MKMKLQMIHIAVTLIVCLFSATGVWAQDNMRSVTLNEGTEINNHVPVFGNQLNHQSQFVLPANDLEVVKDGTIRKLTFYCQPPLFTWGETKYEVYLKEVDFEIYDLDILINENASYGTKVYSGTLSVGDDGRMEILLDEPYSYQGGNLKVSFKQIKRDNWEYAHWYGVNTNSYTAFYAYDGIEVTTFNFEEFLPKITIGFTAPIVLNEEEDNSALIEELDGCKADVTLVRTIVKGMYNTISLPFDVDEATLKEIFGDDVELASLNGSDLVGDNILLEFENTNEYGIIAGWPYLIYVSEDVKNPSFSNVTIKKNTLTIETGYADFIPVVNTTALENGNKYLRFLGANSMLFYPNANSSKMKGFRAYFKLKVEANNAKLTFIDDNETTGVKTVLKKNMHNDRVYDLQGRLVSHPTKGLYIVNGKKLMIP